jgi:hypothetical protein
VTLLGQRVSAVSVPDFRLGWTLAAIGALLTSVAGVALWRTPAPSVSPVARPMSSVSAAGTSH